MFQTSSNYSQYVLAVLLGTRFSQSERRKLCRAKSCQKMEGARSGLFRQNNVLWPKICIKASFRLSSYCLQRVGSGVENEDGY